MKRMGRAPASRVAEAIGDVGRDVRYIRLGPVTLIWYAARSLDWTRKPGDTR